MKYLFHPFLLIGLLSSLVGCAPEPFVRPPLPPLKTLDAEAMRQSFLNSLPKHKVTFDETVIIVPPFHDPISALGELVIDRPADKFQLVGLDHFGVTLLQLSGDSHGTTIDYAVPELLEHKNVLLAIGEDIRRMFFDLVPLETANVEFKDNAAWYSEKTSEGTLVYELGGDPTVLVQKYLDGFWGPAWRVRYYQYVSSSGSLYPFGVVMDNNKYHYRAIVKNRAMQ